MDILLQPHAIDIHEEAELEWSGLGGSYGLSKLLGEEQPSGASDNVALKLSIVRHPQYVVPDEFNQDYKQVY